MNRPADLLSPRKFESFPLLPLAVAALIAGLVLLLGLRAPSGRIEQTRELLYGQSAPSWSALGTLGGWLLKDTALYSRGDGASPDLNGRTRAENRERLTGLLGSAQSVQSGDLLLLRELLNEKRIGDRNARVVGSYFSLAGAALLLFTVLSGLFDKSAMLSATPATVAAQRSNRKKKR